MLTVNLVRLRSDRSQSLNGSIAADASLWEGTELSFGGPIEVVARATVTAESGVVVRGIWKASVVYDCDRCHEEVTLGFEKAMTLFYLPEGLAEEPEFGEAPDPDLKTIGGQETKLKLEEAIREEIVLELPRYFVPEENDDGCCKRCGVAVKELTLSQSENVNNAPSETDPRWSALAALKPEE